MFDKENNVITLELKVPEFYPKQIQFMKSKAKYIAYGGARGKLQKLPLN